MELLGSNDVNCEDPGNGNRSIHISSQASAIFFTKDILIKSPGGNYCSHELKCITHLPKLTCSTVGRNYAFTSIISAAPF